MQATQTINIEIEEIPQVEGPQVEGPEIKEVKKRTKKVIPVCQICDEKLNKSTHQPINCEYCNFDACRTCCETYALNEPTIKCMNTACGREWTRKFIRETFTLVFINGTLKQHREQILFDRERALLPMTQPIIERKIACTKIDKQVSAVREQITILNNQISDLYRERNLISTHTRTNTVERASFVRACPDEDCRGFLSTQWKCGICEKWTCPDCHVIKGYTRDEEHTCDADELATARLLAADTKPCPKCATGIFKIDGCFAGDTQILLFDGTTKMSQDICIGDVLVGDDGLQRRVLDTTTGIDEMYEIQQTNGMSYTVNSKHTLMLLYDMDQQENEKKNQNEKNPQKMRKVIVSDYLQMPIEERNKYKGFKAISNGQYIKSDIKLIPIGRGQYYGWMLDINSIFILTDKTVVHNCDQMWCTQCHTAFSWRTGAIQNAVHNPHYYEWLRRSNGGEAPRNPGDVLCAREMNHELFSTISRIVRNRHVRSPNAKACISRCDAIIRNTTHLNYVERRPAVNYERRNEDLRVKYLMKEITEAEMKIQLQKDDKTHNRNQEQTNIFQMISTTVADIMFRFLHYIEAENPYIEGIEGFSLDILDEIDPIVKYANECLAEVSYTYSCSKLVFTPNVQLHRGNSADRYLNDLKEKEFALQAQAKMQREAEAQVVGTSSSTNVVVV